METEPKGRKGPKTRSLGGRVQRFIQSLNPDISAIGTLAGAYYYDHPLDGKGNQAPLDEPDHDAHEPPPACADVEHGILVIRGTLRSTTDATEIPVLIDLREVRAVTGSIDASPLIEAEDGGTVVAIAVDLAHLLEPRRHDSRPRNTPRRESVTASGCLLGPRGYPSPITTGRRPSRRPGSRRHDGREL